MDYSKNKGIFRKNEPASTSTPNTESIVERIQARQPIGNYNLLITPIRNDDDGQEQPQSDMETEEETEEKEGFQQHRQETSNNQRRFYIPESTYTRKRSRFDVETEEDKDLSPNSLHHRLVNRPYTYQFEPNQNSAQRYSSIPLRLKSNEESQAFDFSRWIVWTVVVTLVAIIIISLVAPNETPTVSITIRDLENNFPLQPHFTWSALESGVNEVRRFEKPSVFILLHDLDTEEALDNLLRDMAEYAMCILQNDCKLEPIILTNSDLVSKKALLDYGYVISKYKKELEQKSVMVVKNLDKVPGTVAQAFHSMCDEYTPLVGKTVFFFTIKVKNLSQLNRTNLQIAEGVLRTSWDDLKDDIFYPLFTRISSMVLKVVN